MKVSKDIEHMAWWVAKHYGCDGDLDICNLKENGQCCFKNRTIGEKQGCIINSWKAVKQL